MMRLEKFLQQVKQLSEADNSNLSDLMFIHQNQGLNIDDRGEDAMFLYEYEDLEMDSEAPQTSLSDYLNQAKNNEANMSKFLPTITEDYLSLKTKIENARVELNNHALMGKLLDIRSLHFKKLAHQFDNAIFRLKRDENATKLMVEELYCDFYKARVAFDRENNIEWYFPDLAKDEETELNNQLKSLADRSLLQSLNHRASEVESEEQTNETTIDTYFKDFIGLSSVKSEVIKLTSFLKVQKARAQQGFSLKHPPTKHMVFTGNPGTGKTEMARLIARIFYDSGIVQSDIFIEADRSSLIAEYLGQTAVKTKELIESAIGGVLFIDEAYAIKTSADDSYGDEAISTLLKMMEDHRDDLVVIVAGYAENMNELLASNPGLRSRFNRFIDFPDYNPEELFAILMKMCANNHYVVNQKPQVKESVMRLIEHAIQESENFANARFIRNYFERVIERHSLRVVNEVNPNLNDLIAGDFEI